MRWFKRDRRPRRTDRGYSGRSVVPREWRDIDRENEGLPAPPGDAVSGRCPGRPVPGEPLTASIHASGDGVAAGTRAAHATGHGAGPAAAPGRVSGGTPEKAFPADGEVWADDPPYRFATTWHPASWSAAPWHPGPAWSGEETP